MVIVFMKGVRDQRSFQDFTAEELNCGCSELLINLQNYCHVWFLFSFCTKMNIDR